MKFANKFGSGKHQAGFTLVEVLVALVVMAVGMLGIAALYVEGLRAGRTAIYRTTAVSLAADMADRIRANPDAAASYAGVGPGANNGCVNGPADCSATQVAQDDWFWWLQTVNQNMPNGTSAAIAVQDLALTTQYNITISWPETGLGTISYTLAMQF